MKGKLKIRFGIYPEWNSMLISEINKIWLNSHLAKEENLKYFAKNKQI